MERLNSNFETGSMPSTGVIVTPWSPRRQPLATADPRAAVLFRLQRLLARDEQVRRPPPISLPHATQAALASPRPSPPAPAPAIPAVAAIVAAVEAHFGVPVTLVRERERTNAPRHPAEEILIYLVRSLRWQTLVACAAELGISDAKAWNACSKIRHRRAVDPDLDRALIAIEAQLSAAR